jgi:hypothetical protein
MLGSLMWSAPSDDRTGLSFTIVAGPRQRSLSRVRVPWDSGPYFTFSDLRLPFSSPPATRRVTVVEFDSASTQVSELTSKRTSVIKSRLGPTENTALLLLLKSFPWEYVLFAKALPSNGSCIFPYLEVVA